MSYYYSTVNGITMNHSEVTEKDEFEIIIIQWR